MNNREVAIAALLRQGWVATSRPAATPLSAPAPSPSPRPKRQQQPPIMILPSPSEDRPSAASTSQQTETETQTPDPSSSYTLIDLSEETSPNITPLPSSPPSSSTTPSSSRESLAAGFAALSSSSVSLLVETMEMLPEESEPENEKKEEVEEEQSPQTANEEEEQPQQEPQQISQEAQPTIPDNDDDLFTLLPPFFMPDFSHEPPAAVQQAKPPSMREWILCSEVGLQFMRPARKRIISCVSCGTDCQDGAGTGKTGEHGGPVFRSSFWRMTSCRAGHRPPRADTATAQTGLCSSCDKDYVLRVVRGKVLCAHEGCRRLLRVHQQDVEDELWDHPGLWTAFRELIRSHAGYECAIHFDRVDDEDNTHAPLTAECQHDRNACVPCLTLLCEAAIQGDRLDDLVCPEPQCRQRLGRDTIRQHVTAESLRLYDKKLAFAAMARNPSFRWCRCGHGQLHEAGEARPEWTCALCHERHCFVCGDDEVDADGHLCEHLRRANLARAMAAARDEHERTRLTSEVAAQQRRAAQVAVGRLAVQARENTRGTQMVIATTAKRCPRLGCQAPIQRDEGCAHMTCRRCRTEFCWSCKVIWKVSAGTAMGTPVGNVASAGILSPMHLTTCPLASRRTIERRHLNTSLYGSRWDIDTGYDRTLDHDLWLQEDQQ